MSYEPYRKIFMENASLKKSSCGPIEWTPEWVSSGNPVKSRALRVSSEKISSNTYTIIIIVLSFIILILTICILKKFKILNF